jgi:hypothetical protein
VTLYRFTIVGHKTLSGPVSLWLSDLSAARQHAAALLAEIRRAPECANGCRVVVTDHNGRIVLEVGH